MGEFSLSDFGRMLSKASEELDHHLHEALEHCAEHVETEAKGRIGHYNGPSGPFPAWAPLAESTVADRASKGYPADQPLLRTGEMRESIRHEVGEHEAVIGSDSEVALVQEVGNEKIPPRSFLGAAGAASLSMISATFGMAIVTAVRKAQG